MTNKEPDKRGVLAITRRGFLTGTAAAGAAAALGEPQAPKAPPVAAGTIAYDPKPQTIVERTPKAAPPVPPANKVSTLTPAEEKARGMVTEIVEARREMIAQTPQADKKNVDISWLKDPGNTELRELFRQTIGGLEKQYQRMQSYETKEGRETVSTDLKRILLLEKYEDSVTRTALPNHELEVLAGGLPEWEREKRKTINALWREMNAKYGTVQIPDEISDPQAAPQEIEANQKAIQEAIIAARIELIDFANDFGVKMRSPEERMLSLIYRILEEKIGRTPIHDKSRGFLSVVFCDFADAVMFRLSSGNLCNEVLLRKMEFDTRDNYDDYAGERPPHFFASINPALDAAHDQRVNTLPLSGLSVSLVRNYEELKIVKTVEETRIPMIPGLSFAERVEYYLRVLKKIGFDPDILSRFEQNKPPPIMSYTGPRPEMLARIDEVVVTIPSPAQREVGVPQVVQSGQASAGINIGDVVADVAHAAQVVQAVGTAADAVEQRREAREKEVPEGAGQKAPAAHTPVAQLEAPKGDTPFEMDPDRREAVLRTWGEREEGRKLEPGVPIPPRQS